ncbi:MAG TPA: class I lanthipeptide [Thermoanaerobaculia bacterium]|nr:class I lanthipeptide [Thermoanaerobaculia bacterium]
MKKTSLQKLALRRETIRNLRDNILQDVAGGKGPTAIDCSVTCLKAPDQTSFNC